MPPSSTCHRASFRVCQRGGPLAGIDGGHSISARALDLAKVSRVCHSPLGRLRCSGAPEPDRRSTQPGAWSLEPYWDHVTTHITTHVTTGGAPKPRPGTVYTTAPRHHGASPTRRSPRTPRHQGASPTRRSPRTPRHHGASPTRRSPSLHHVTHHGASPTRRSPSLHHVTHHGASPTRRSPSAYTTSPGG